jgi:hypothetical protein
MFRFPTRRLSIALLAQIVFCLVAAPVIAAQQWAALPLSANNEKKDAPRETRVTIQAAFDASNVRPEEVSDAEQKKGRSRSGVNRTGSNRVGETDRDAVGSALADASTNHAARSVSVGQTFMSARIRERGHSCHPSGFELAREDMNVLHSPTRWQARMPAPPPNVFAGRALPAFWNASALGGQCPPYIASLAPTLSPSFEGEKVLRRSLRDHDPAFQPTGPPAT